MESYQRKAKIAELQAELARLDQQAAETSCRIDEIEDLVWALQEEDDPEDLVECLVEMHAQHLAGVILR